MYFTFTGIVMTLTSSSLNARLMKGRSWPTETCAAPSNIPRSSPHVQGNSRRCPSNTTGNECGTKFSANGYFLRIYSLPNRSCLIDNCVFLKAGMKLDKCDYLTKLDEFCRTKGFRAPDWRAAHGCREFIVIFFSKTAFVQVKNMKHTQK